MRRSSSYLRFMLPLFAVCLGAHAQGSLINSDNFDAATGWSDNRLFTVTSLGNESILGGVNQFSGLTTTKSFALTGNQQSLQLDLRFYRFDTWDNESFQILLDGNIVYSRSFSYLTFDPDETTFIEPGPVNTTDAFTDISVTYATTATSVNVAFRSTLDQNPGDESWGIDNFVLSDDLATAAVPEPATFSMFAMAILGSVCLTKRRRD